MSLLGPDILISHSNFPHEDDGKLIADCGAHTSSTPNTELQLGWPPIGLRADHYANASLGVDCHSWASASIPLQAQLLLQHARNERQEKLRAESKWSRHTGFDVEQVFNLATIGGAKAAGLADQVGRLKEGFKADLVIFDTTSMAMMSASEEDPVAAVILHSSVRDVDAVIIDGVMRKQNGKLADLVVAEGPNETVVMPTGSKFGLDRVRAEVLKSRKALDQRAEGIDWKAVEEGTIDEFYMNRNGLPDGE